MTGLTICLTNICQLKSDAKVFLGIVCAESSTYARVCSTRAYV